METQIGNLYEQLGDLKSKLTKLVEENHRLTMENEHLRSYLNEENLQNGGQTAVTKERDDLPSEAIDNLARIYKDGFHICHMQFGSPCSEDENCLFCLDRSEEHTSELQSRGHLVYSLLLEK